MDETIRLARGSGRRLRGYGLSGRTSVRLRVEDDLEVIVPAAALPRFARLLDRIAREAQAAAPGGAEVSVRRAADILGVSRPFVLGLLDEGQVPSRRVGRRRRIRLDDLMEYKRADDDRRSRLLDQLVAEAQELGLRY